MRAVEYVVFITILAFFFFLMPDMIQYAKVSFKVNQVADYAVERMAIEGGWSADVADAIQNELARQKLDPDRWEVEHTSGRVGAPETVYLKMSRDYHITAFNIFGESMGRALADVLSVPIVAQKVQASQVYIRQEG